MPQVSSQELPLRIFHKIREHGIRPMQHTCFKEGKRFCAKAYIVAGLGNFIGPVILVKVKTQSFFTHLRTDDFLGLNQLDHIRQTSGMIHLHMVHHNIIDFLRINDFTDPGEHIVFHTLFYCIDQCDFLINNEIRIVGGAAVG